MKTISNVNTKIMTNYKTILILIAVFFLTGSCKNSQNTKAVAKEPATAKSKATSIQTIDVDNNLDNKKVVKLSDISKKIEYVRLGGSQKHPIGHIMSYSITDDFIFIRGAGSPVYKFDRKGKFIKQFGRVGKGPGEFGKYARFSTDNKNRLLCLYDYNKRKFITYNFDGEYLYSVNAYHGTFEEFTILNKKPILSYGISYGIQRYRLTTYNKDGEIIDSLMNPDTFKKRERTMVLGTNFDYYMQKFDNSVIYKGEYSDIAYSINGEGKVSKKYIVNQGKIIPLENRVYR